ncbi:Zn(2)-C6 fungal-type domain-containing protein [Fusarium sp. LHS14.1]|nr:Zn(2)-C6 fungal-type domain-containing protein [Fusarium sp. LHS14.1]
MDVWAGRPRRKITTCGECHRRKQKCNREKPCNFCLRRGVPDRCRYDESPQQMGSMDSANPINPQLTSCQDPLISESPFLHQAGYSRTSSANSIVCQSESSEAIQTPSLSTGSGTLALLTTPVKNDYWDLLAQLPPLPVIEDLVEVFFSEANWHFQILDESYFIELYQTWVRANLSRSPPPAQPASLELLFFPALLFQVLAIAMLFLPDDSPSRHNLSLWDFPARTTLSDRYSRIGSHLADLFQQSTTMLVMVQHDLAKSLWLKTNNKGLASWQLLGRAIRQAQELGLHLNLETDHDCDGSSQDALSLIWSAEHRRRLWATLFSWDSHMAVLLGRPRTVNMSDCTEVTPIGCDIPLDRSNALPTPPSSSAKPPIFTNRLFTYALGKKIHEILSLSAHTRAVSDYGAVTRLHAEIVDLWRNHHPALRCNNPDTTWDKQYPIVKRQREFAKAMATSVILTLHRDHAAIHQESRFEAMEAALGCLEAQDALMNLLPANQRCIYGLSCHCIDACIFIAYATRLEDTVDQNMLDRVQTGIKQSIMRLRQLENESSFAKHGIQAMEKALELIGPRVQLAIAPADDQARNSPLDTALSSSSESIERNLNMALNNGQFYPGIFEQAGDVSLAMPDLGLFGFDVAGHLSTDGGVLGETRYYLDPSRQ